MPIMHDLECSTCGLRVEDFQFPTMASVRSDIDCPKCGYATLGIIYVAGFRFDPNASGIYGKFYPSFGCMVNSYGEKKALCKRYGVIEAGDTLRGSRDFDMPEGYNGPGQPSTPSRRDVPSKEDLAEGWTLGEALSENAPLSDSRVRESIQKALARHDQHLD